MTKNTDNKAQGSVAVAVNTNTNLEANPGASANKVEEAPIDLNTLDEPVTDTIVDKDT